MQESQARLDELVRAFRQEGIDFKPRPRGWRAELRTAIATIHRWDDDHQLRLEVGSRLITTGLAQARPIDWCAVEWGPLLRVLNGYEALLLTSGIGDLWVVECDEQQRYVVRAIGGEDAVECANRVAYPSGVEFLWEWPA